MMISKTQKILFVVCFFSVFLISLAYSFYFKVKPTVDARAYDNIAWNVARGNGYREQLDVPITEDQSIIRVGPGYEYFLAGIYYIFGHHLAVVWLIQAMLMALSFLLMFQLSREVFREYWNYYPSLAVALLIGLSPDLITIQSMLLSEVLGIFLTILSLLLFFKYYNNSDRPIWLVGLLGLSLGAASLVRTPILLLLLPVLFYLVYLKKYKHLLIFILGVVVLFIPWTIRNYQVFNDFVPTNSAGGYNILTGNHPGASGEQGDPYPPLNGYISQLGYFQANKKATSEGIHFILSRPLVFILTTLKRTSIYFSFARPTGFWFHLYGPSKALTLFSSSAYSVILYVLGFYGLISSLKLQGKDKSRGLFLIFFLVLTILPIVMLVVETRYRFSAYPFFAIFAGLTVADIFQRKIAWRVVFFVAMTLFLNTAIDVIRDWGRIVEKIKTL